MTTSSHCRHPTPGVCAGSSYQVPEPKVSKSRMHVDLASKDPESEIERLVRLGATRLESRAGDGARWTVMLDPEGNEFCIG